MRLMGCTITFWSLLPLWFDMALEAHVRGGTDEQEIKGAI
jgi:hypothetical protein